MRNVVVVDTLNILRNRVLDQLRERLQSISGVIESKGQHPYEDGLEFHIPIYSRWQDKNWALIIPRHAPFSLPRLAMRCKNKDDPILSRPHVENESGLLCLAQTQGLEANPFSYVDTCIHLLQLGYDYVNEDWDASSDEDFRSEWLSYWPRNTNDIISTVHVLVCRDELQSELFTIEFNGEWIIATSEAQIHRIISSRGLRAGEYEAYPVPSLILDQPLTPDAFPNSYRDLHHLFELHDKHIQLEKAVHENNGRILIWLVACNDKNGFSLAGGCLDMRPIPARRAGEEGFLRHTQIGDGFRNTPPYDVLKHRLSPKSFSRFNIERYDHSWVHGRQHDMKAGVLKGKNVAIIGAGSLGSGIAELLIKAGVGKLLIIDHDRMHPENAARHVLGCESVGMFKSKALAARLNRHDPSINVESHVDNGERWLDNLKEGEFNSFDLIIDATGEWSFSSLLNNFISSVKPHPPIVWTWLEAHCLAAHASLTSHSTGCINCFLKADGQMKLPVLEPNDFSEDIALCGGTFQPYGAISLAAAQTLAADLAIESLTNDTLDYDYRVWIAGAEKVNAVDGAVISESWKDTVGSPSCFSSVHKCEIINCEICGR